MYNFVRICFALQQLNYNGFCAENVSSARLTILAIHWLAALTVRNGVKSKELESIITVQKRPDVHSVLHWIWRFAVNMNKVKTNYGIVLILVASCSFRWTLSFYWQCVYLHSVVAWLGDENTLIRPKDNHVTFLKLNFRKYPAIHSNYITPQSTAL